MASLNPSSSSQLPSNGWWPLALKICVSVYLIARGWLTWRWDSPIRGLVWKEEWWTGWVEKSGKRTWSDFANQSDVGITTGLMIMGISLMALGVVPWLVRRSGGLKLAWLMIPAMIVVFIDGFASWVGRDYEFAMAIEHVLQIGTPILFLMAVRKPAGQSGWFRLATVLAALTFLGHALYAVGFHTVPLNFKLMTQGLLGVHEQGAVTFLAVVGWLDIVAAVGVFFRVTRIPSLLYMIVWGGLTAVARLASHSDLTADRFGLDPWLMETLVRTPHWLIPLLLLALVYREKGTENSIAVS